MGQGGLLTFSAKTSWREIASFRAFKKVCNRAQMSLVVYLA